MDDDHTVRLDGSPFAIDGVHLLRTTQQVQHTLSQMADQKANMLLGITFVIFTLSIGQAASAGPREPAVLILAAAAFVAAVLAMLAVLPSVKPPPRDAPVNVLFFGAFSQMPEDEYVKTMLAILTDQRGVYEAFARDIHQHGTVLARKKYRLISHAYRVLLVGLVCSLIAFVISYLARLFA